MSWDLILKVSLELVHLQRDLQSQFSLKNCLSREFQKLELELSQLLFQWTNSCLFGAEVSLENFILLIESKVLTS
jgi:hypothetical protein